MHQRNFLEGTRGILGLAGMFLLAAGVARAAEPPINPGDMARLVEAIKPAAELRKWQQIPWVTDLKEARRLAKEERRPIFLWVSEDEPLERC